MKSVLQSIGQSIQSFVKEEEGAQVVEYALIIAVVSIGLVVALTSGTSSLKTAFTTLIARVTTCFTAGSTCT